MPYYLHPKDMDPINGTVYLDRASAFTHQKTAGLQASHTITFVASDDERERWIDRELARFESGEYIRTPWSDRIRTWLSAYTYDDDGNAIHKHNPLYLHFAHLSLSTPGYIAYTKDEEHGIRDVQTRVRPGKYLSQFFPNFSQAEVIDYCGRCNAEALSLKFATDAQTIETVYTNGPDSCMRKSFNLPVHPTAVYASTFEDGRPLPDPADVAIAYFGSAEHVRARAIVWPERKLHGRIYGDEATLRALLQRDGFNAGSMRGAHVRKIKYRRDAYIMPYVDGIGSAKMDGGRFQLCQDDDHTYATQNTNGTTRDRTTYSCDHCGDDYEYDENEEYASTMHCPHCEENRTTCKGCCESIWHDDDDVHCTDNGCYCDSCFSEHDRDCVCCDRSFNPLAFGYHENRDRRGASDNLCTPCVTAGCSPCEHCDEWQHQGETCDCCDDETETEDEVTA
jgi:hypothetical protein